MTDVTPGNSPGPDPRRRALVALVVVLLLVVAGLILVHVLQNMSRIQDCAMSGRTNCVPIDTPTSAR
jgi:hypothetical protein